ncbi:DUF5916 domain-containing protein [Flavobacterium sp. GT3R68]|uniref:DUF5916 domain-containing protein n=1 Tax=Flavobacterium sp. GT3R68 TaxID=2594437 RepID=UPI000F878C4E|nr:DUF5916 domain-containing protein [Flavobacterium sp. GT3R68]RTY87533.1 hydrolase [Flavobacterium sp. GSN2]TRW90444.1 hydrolase [Flavobacterium sp. GT3R68]
MKRILLVSFLFLCSCIYGQKKVLQTKSVATDITIDGNLNEEGWSTVPAATDFVMFEPDNGKPIADTKKTEVKVLYDNDAVYVGVLLYDDQPDKIFKEIAQRDDLGSSDFFAVFINGFNDGQQDFRFFVSAADGQLDCVATDSNGEDFSWDAVWESKAKITDFGWVVEMRIPYAALRFSPEKKQTWGINFFRNIQRDRQKYSWNFIDSKLGTFTQQTGILEGIENIKPPTRLFLLPYASYYADANAVNKTKGTIKGGLDIKYGINDAFTLDMILVPDFGQTKYDEQVLNLGPFEQQFNENRAFFTEGTDLFSKGNLFYSRRIGGNPVLDYGTLRAALPSDIEISEYPNNVSLINAFKISGRTKNGLGIGVLNAITENTIAKVRNTGTGETAHLLVDPLTNYNVLVFDQRFNKNSSVSFVNTNVIRDGSFYDANVSALVWDLNTRKNTYNLSGNYKYSYRNDAEQKQGVSTTVNLNETSGNYRSGIGADLVTKDYDNNDLGINFETNYYVLYGFTTYRILNPTKYFNSFNSAINVFSQFQKETGKLQGNNINMNVNLKNKKNHYFGFGIDYNALESFNYYEPRAENRYVITPEKIGGWFYFSSNYNYKFAIDFNPSYAKFNETERDSYGFSLGPRYRFNDKFSMNYYFNFFRQNNNKGWVDSIDDDNNASTPNTIIFANRNVITYSNTLSGKYSVNSKMNLNLSVRHYWSYADNKNFLSLEQNGRLSDYVSYTKNKNSSFNSWNVDLSYSWWFAPGSQVSVLYRNNAGNFEREINKRFDQNVTHLLNNDALSHVFSISVKYFIDYNQAKNWF